MGTEPAPPAAAPTLRERRFGTGGSLRVRTARGTIINGAFLTLIMALGMLRGFVVAAFLTTAEYGVWGLLIAMIATLVVLKQVGIGEKYGQQDSDDDVRAFHRAFTFELLVSLVFAAFGIALMVAAAAIYGVPEIVAPGLVLLLMLPAAALQMPLVVFYRRMDFAKQRKLQAVDPIVAFIVTVGLAVAGLGYWSIVAGTVAGTFVGGAVAVAASPYRLRFAFDRKEARSYFHFSWPILVAGLSAVVTAQGLVAAGEATLGLAGVGIIALVASISQFADRADRAITDTMYPAICAVKDRADLLYESFVTSNRLALMWAVPFGAGLALFADDLLVGLLGEEWGPGVGLLQATAVALGLHQVGFNWQAFYRARDETKPIAVAGVVGVVVFLAVVMPLLILEGLGGLAVGVLVAEAVYLVMRMMFLRRLFPALRAFRHLLRAIAPSLPAVAVVLAVRTLSGDRSTAQIAVELAAYLAITAAFTWRFERGLLREIRSYLGGSGGMAHSPAAVG